MDIPAILSVTTLFFLSLVASSIIIYSFLFVLDILEMPYYGSKWTFIWGIFWVTSIFIVLHSLLYPQLYIFWFSPLNVIANWIGAIFGNPQLSCMSLFVIIIGISFLFGFAWFIWSRFDDGYNDITDLFGNFFDRNRIRDTPEIEEIKPKRKKKPIQMDDDNFVQQKVTMLEDKPQLKVKIGDDGELIESQPFQITIHGKGDQVSDGFHLEEGSYRIRCKKKGDEGWVRVSVVSLDNKKREPIDLDFFRSGSELLEIEKTGRYTFKINSIFYELQWGIRVEKI